jgi:hypothetical protein
MPSFGQINLQTMAGAWVKDSVWGATTANVTLSGVQNFDGIVGSANLRYLVKNQTNPVENGVYLMQAGAWTRALDSDGTMEISAATVNVYEGTVNGGTKWTTDLTTAQTVGTDPMIWRQTMLPDIPASTLAASAVTVSTTEKQMVSLKIPANSVKVGSAFRLTLYGVTAASGNPTFKVRMGTANTIADATAATIGAITHTVAAGGSVTFMGIFRSIGSSGTIMVNGTALMGVVANAQSAAAPSTITINTTVDQFLSITVTMSASTFTAHTGAIETIKI